MCEKNAALEADNSALQKALEAKEEELKRSLRKAEANVAKVEAEKAILLDRLTELRQMNAELEEANRGDESRMYQAMMRRDGRHVSSVSETDKASKTDAHNTQIVVSLECQVTF